MTVSELQLYLLAGISELRKFIDERAKESAEAHGADPANADSYNGKQILSANDHVPDLEHDLGPGTLLEVVFWIPAIDTTSEHWIVQLTEAAEYPFCLLLAFRGRGVEVHYVNAKEWGRWNTGFQEFLVTFPKDGEEITCNDALEFIAKWWSWCHERLSQKPPA